MMVVVFAVVAARDDDCSYNDDGGGGFKERTAHSIRWVVARQREHISGGSDGE
jgi:hypothetical protein